MSKKVCSISQLTSAKETRRVSVRCVHIWATYSKDRPNDKSSIEMVIKDDHKHQIQATIRTEGDHVAAIVESTYPSLLHNFGNQSFFEDRAILAPTNSVVERINDYVMSLIPGDERVYLSSDTICKSYVDGTEQSQIYSTDFLNSIKCSGIPNHVLTLEVGVPVMLIRNMDQANGLCNGTRLFVTQLGERVIEGRILSGNNIGMNVYIPRMVLSPSDSRLSFQFQRRQFLLIVCFGMTINKSQGQTLSHVDLFLPKPVFSHEQLYVAFSRVKSRKGLKVLCCDDNGIIVNKTPM